MLHRPRIIPMPTVFIACCSSISLKQLLQRHIVVHCTTFRRAKRTSRLIHKPFHRTKWLTVHHAVAEWWTLVLRAFDIVRDQWMRRTRRVCFTVCTVKMPVRTSPCPANWLQPTCAWAHCTCTNCIIARIVDAASDLRNRVNSTFGKRHISSRIPMPVHRVLLLCHRHKPQRKRNHKRQLQDKKRPPRKLRCSIRRRHNTRLNGCSKVLSIEFVFSFFK